MGTSDDELTGLVREASDSKRSQDDLDERPTLAVVVFNVGGAWCALRADAVQKVVEHTSITPVPGVPAEILGVSLVYGRLVPVVDLPALLDMSDAKQDLDAEGRLVIVGTELAEVGFMAAETRGVLHLPAERERHDDASSSLIRSDLSWDERLVSLLDDEALLQTVSGGQ